MNTDMMTTVETDEKTCRQYEDMRHASILVYEKEFKINYFTKLQISNYIESVY